MLAFLDTIPFGTPRLRRIMFWLATTFTIYVLVGFFIIPPLLKSIIISQGTDALNRETTLGEVRFNPLTLDLEIEKLFIQRKDGSGPLLSLNKATASPGLATIWKFAPVISYLTIDGLTIDITFYGDGKYSISDLIGSKAKKRTEEEETGEKTTVFPFALYGFEMSNATIVFDDQPHNKKHVISKLDMMVPFTSSFLNLRKKYTQPQISAVINGDPIHLNGRILPFDQSLQTEFQLGAVDVDLRQYWTYLPIQSSLKLISGQFTSNISLIFERPDAQRMNLFLGGGGTLKELKLSTPEDGEVFSLDKLQFSMDKFSLGENELVLNEIALTHPDIKVIRKTDDTFNWATYFPVSSPTPNAASITPVNADNGTKAVQDATPASPFEVDIKSFTIRDGTIRWVDNAVPGGFKRDFDALAVTGTDLSSRVDKENKFSISLGSPSMLKIDGTTAISPLTVRSKVEVTDISIPDFLPYIAETLPMTVTSGVVSLNTGINFSLDDDHMNLGVDNASIVLNKLALRNPKAQKPSITLGSLTVTGASVDVEKKSVVIDNIAFQQPNIRLTLNKNGSIDPVDLFTASPTDNEQLLPDKKDAQPAHDSEQWNTQIQTITIQDGEAAFHDSTLVSPATLAVHALHGKVTNVTTTKGETTHYQIGTQWGKAGKLQLDGDITVDTLSGTGRFLADKINLRPFDSYLGESTELLFASGRANADLRYSFSANDVPHFALKGDAGLTNVSFKDNSGDGEIAQFKQLSLSGLNLANEPYRLIIDNVVLDTPSAFIHFDKNGQLNFRRVFRLSEEPPASDKKTEHTQQLSSTPTEAAVAPDSVPPAVAVEEPFFDTLEIGKITVKNGQTTMRDASVHPPYTTETTDLNLDLVGVSQSPGARPKMDLSAKIGPTPLSIAGTLNPVITPIYSDLTVALNGMELVPLTPYTIKNLGYPVEKGRLYADVKFKTENWLLTANNKFFIEQLVLGAKDPSPDAPNVPVKFGLALLQDGNGDVEINLPIRGRLDDPDFRIGGIVFKAIASLFVKALASPFSLIGSIFGGGGEDMDFVVFEPGRHSLDKTGLAKLETTIKALQARKKLKLEVDGVIAPDEDKRGLIKVKFERKLKQQKYDTLLRGQRAETSLDQIVIEPEEYAEYLFEAYKDEDDPDGVRPGSLFGVEKQPTKTMEDFILSHITVTDEDLNELAVQRATAIKTHIIEVDPSLAERVYLLDRREKRKGKTGVPMHRADLGIK